MSYKYSNLDGSYNFGFVYKRAVQGQIFYNGDPATAKFCVDPQEAVFWYGIKSETKESFTYDDGLDIVEMTIPAITHTEGMANITPQFRKRLYLRIKEGKISDDVKNGVIEFLKEFEVYSNGDTPMFKKMEKKERVIDDGLLAMKLFIAGLYRFEPVKAFEVKDGKKTANIEEIEIGQSYREIAYTVNNVKLTTPIHGVYAPRFVESLFGQTDVVLESGQRLERWQREFLLDFGQENYLLAARGMGKSLLCSLLVELFTMGQSSDKFKARMIAYFGPTEDSIIDSVIPYIQNSIDMFGQYYFEYVDSKKSLFFKTVERGKEKVLGIVRFMSAESRGIRGKRLFAAIIDEAAICNQEVYNIIKGNLVSDGTIMFNISTIDKDSDRNWFYQNAVYGELKQFEYENNEELIVKLRKKYDIDIINNIKDIDLKELEAMRREYLAARPIVTKRYTIYQSEHKVQKFGFENLKRTIEDTRKQKGDAYVKAEFFATYMDKKKVLDVSGALDDIPSKFDDIIIYLDKANSYDNAAVTIAGVEKGKIYIIESLLISRDRNDQIIQCKELITPRRQRLHDNKKEIMFGADITQDKAWIDLAQMKGLEIDFPMYSLPGTDKEYVEAGIYYCGKRQLVKYTQEAFEYFFVRINRELQARQNSLIEEINNFGVKKTSSGRETYKALEGKDDQVLAMMNAIYVLYVLVGNRRDFLENDNEMSKVKQEDLARANDPDFLRELYLNKQEEKKNAGYWYANRY